MHRISSRVISLGWFKEAVKKSGKIKSKSFEKEFLSLHGNADNEEVYVACLCKGKGI